MQERFLALLFAAVALGACTPETAFVPSAQGDPICAARAGTRADDAAIAGFDEGLQEKIRAYTYKDCLVWAAKSSTAGFR